MWCGGNVPPPPPQLEEMPAGHLGGRGPPSSLVQNCSLTPPCLSVFSCLAFTSVNLSPITNTYVSTSLFSVDQVFNYLPVSIHLSPTNQFIYHLLVAHL